MRKPSLTPKVLRGLTTLSGVVGAGTCADILGNEPSDPETRKTWEDILRACEWIDEMVQYKHVKSGK